ncbi:cell division protein FtsQ/DivIB [Tepidibacter thalassicus]|uniref:Cell division protein FtsQ n=1 Tax=Tepidibacter thalassicus DSM 15285 TaxID=1123350 RepID=A0A1M5QFM9_9FIRM|nr:FtsQ-type POTRA domain-containing protein [Tepidibacter thalassicus]SHH12313.1 cell division protein FtsQ [Tepidibacter thalassicus DSM 15285]
MKKIHKILLLLLVLIVSIFGYIFMKTDFLCLKELEIIGQVKLNKEDILNSGKIEMNKNIYMYNLKDIKNNLLKNPYIKDVNIKIKFPNKMIIDLAERVDMCAIPYMGSYVLISEEGTVLKVEEDIKNVDKALLTGINFKNLKVGEKIKLDDSDFLAKILDLINSCNNANILSNISEINVDKNKNIRLYTIQGIEVLLGKGEDVQYKMLALNKILIDLYTRNISKGIVDMRYKGYPVYRPE